ncbi:MAG: hypothetical protein WA667_20095 [Candidatus Nitrosopolaris sp.]
MNFNFAKIQTKLKISQLGDIYERQADRIVEQILTISTLQETIDQDDPKNEEKINRKCTFYCRCPSVLFFVPSSLHKIKQFCFLNLR